MCGVAQKARTSPVISGCRTMAWRPPTCSSEVVTDSRGAAQPACRSPVSSRWSTANVAAIASTQPAAHDVHSTTAADAVDVPDLAAPGLPQRHHQDEADVGGQDVRRALERRRDPATQPQLDATTRHHRVLHGEQREEGQVDGHGDRRGRARRSVHGPGDDDSGEEGDGPQRDDDEPRIADGGQEQGHRLAGHAHHAPLRATSAQPWNYLTCAARARRTRRRPGRAT